MNEDALAGAKSPAFERSYGKIKYENCRTKCLSLDTIEILNVKKKKKNTDSHLLIH